MSLAISIANAFLLWRLIGRDATILFVMLASFVLLQFWGYHFRPYNIIFSCILGAERKGGLLVAGTLILHQRDQFAGDEGEGDENGGEHDARQGEEHLDAVGLEERAKKAPCPEQQHIDQARDDR